MKTKYTLTPFFILFLFLLASESNAQGRVVINEFMPWSPNNCAVNGEFVELMNFGPGPMDISCYVVTNGRYAVTIPPNTIIQPGEFYVIAGSNILPQSCGNVDSAVHVQLNWNTCNCINTPIPASGDGFFQDGGGANEKVVLLNPQLQIVDAVTRNSPPTPSDLITIPAVGNCPSRTFDLDHMSINYEVLGMSTGVGNSFARTIDGDCQWVKDPPQSAHATNNRAGDVSAVEYSLSITGARDCGSGGSINIHVNIVDGTVTDYNRMFPMNYAIAYDANNDGIFDLENDTYTYGTDDTPPSIDIVGLPIGRYRIVVGSVLGCFLATFNVNILICEDPLRAQLLNFEKIKETSKYYTFQWMLTNPELIKSIELETSNNGRTFKTQKVIPVNLISQTYKLEVSKEQEISYYRLKITGTDGHSFYSPVINTNFVSEHPVLIGPNPVRNILFVKFPLSQKSLLNYKIYNTSNNLVATGVLNSYQEHQTNISVQNMVPGIYQLVIWDKNESRQPFSFRFVKQ